jgi:hypothetical protein
LACRLATVEGVNSIKLPLLCLNVPNHTTLHSGNQNHWFKANWQLSFLQFEESYWFKANWQPFWHVEPTCRDDVARWTRHG